MSRIFGHDRPLEVMHAALASGRMHHAWVFSGPRGVGKFTVAMDVARLLLDPDASVSKRPDGRVNPASRVQGLIDAGTHPDLHIIRKELALYSEHQQLRDRKLMRIPLALLRERVIGGRVEQTAHEAPAYRTAALGHGKVFIIDEAELLAPDAQDAMLKTLEEPPPQTWFFLITSKPNRLLPTIHSRSQHVRFGPLSPAEMNQWWQQHLESASAGTPATVGSSTTAAAEPRSRKGAEAAFDPRKVSARSLEWAFNFAEGSPGLALLALEYGFDQWQQTLEPMLKELESGRFPATMGERLGAMVEDFAQAWVKRHGKDHTSKDAANKDGARHVLALLSSHSRRRLSVCAGDEDHTMRWSDVIDALRETERQIDFNVNQKLALENLVAQWRLALSGERV